MNQEPLGKFLGLTRNELRIFLFMGGLLLCVIMLSASYIVYSSGRAASAIPSRTFPPVQIPTTPPPYRPAPSLTGWPPITPRTSTATIPPTRTRRPTPSPLPTSTPRSTRTPTPVPPTATAQLGTFGNPVPIGSALAIPDLGELTLLRSSWVSGQTGLMTVELSFVCGRPVSQQCKTSKLMLNAVGDSGKGYARAFDPEIPEPTFGYELGAAPYGGGTERGNAGFLIDNSESSLVLLVRVFLEEGQYFFWIGPGSG